MATPSPSIPATCSRAPRPTGEKLKLADVKVLTPCDPSKMICLWNNFHQLAAKNNFQRARRAALFPEGAERLSSRTASRSSGRRPTPASIVYEGELGVVIGKKCFNVSEAEAKDYIFGYTCVNDVTAVDLLEEIPTFDQWARAKSFDTFGVFGPVIATGVDPTKLVDPHRPQRQGSAELSGRRHVLPALQAGGRGLQGHDADAGRHHRLRHLARRRRDGRAPRTSSRS